MKKLYIYLFSGFVALAMSSNILHSNPNGAPLGVTGSPADGATCAQSGCHFGSATAGSNIISSDIPAEGYNPGQTYNFTVTTTGNGAKGFMVSPQKSDGTLLGTLAAGSGNKLFLSKYITHTSAKSGTSATWSFSWTAPAQGTGAVDFYGAFAITRNTTLTDKYTVNEKTSTGLSSANAAINALSIYPNPIVNNSCTIEFKLNKGGNAKISVVDLTGREVLSMQETFGKGLQQVKLNLPELNNGMYFVQVSQNEQSVSKRVFVNQ